MTINQAAKVMKALSHPNRLDIYLRIVRGEQSGFAAEDCCAASFVACLKIGAPTVSHHLKELVNAGLIVTERQGKFLIAKPVLSTWAEVKKLLPG
jgi:DNA-binding transcriptional ArsR family regulator